MVYKQYSFYTGNAVDQKDVTFPIRGSPFVAAFKLREVTIPLAFNSTDSSNNTIVFERSGSVKSAQVPAGNYNAATYPPALQKAMNDASAVKDYTVTWDEVTRRLTISAGSSFTIRNFSGGTTMWKQLGMSKYGQPISGSSVTMGIADFTSYAPLLLVSTRLNSKDMAYAADENINVLASIDANSAVGSVARWINHNGSYLNVGSNLPSLDLRLLNGSTLLPVDLSQPYSLTLSILTDIDDSVMYH
ncbi:hypothetical protein HDV00_009895 [Rhizophlyctis rosea]|nr:hypothetical protein HDV00_009895 [Rhizophlyctis rosea]